MSDKFITIHNKYYSALDSTHHREIFFIKVEQWQEIVCSLYCTVNDVELLFGQFK
jgi:dTDP-4-dehydrorhamnose reductase